MFYPIYTEVTLAHAHTLWKLWCTKGAGYRTAMAADTEILVDINNAILLSFKDSPCWAYHHAGGISAVQTGNRKEGYRSGREPSFLHAGDMPEGRAVIR